MNRFWPIALLILASACFAAPADTRALDALEARLAITAAQRPAWQAFRKEAARAQSRWSGSHSPGLQELRAAAAAEKFDRERARSAARQGYEDAQALIDAWSRVDAQLTEPQRAELRRAPPF